MVLSEQNDSQVHFRHHGDLGICSSFIKMLKSVSLITNYSQISEQRIVKEKPNNWPFSTADQSIQRVTFCL